MVCDLRVSLSRSIPQKFVLKTKIFLADSTLGDTRHTKACFLTSCYFKLKFK